MQWRKIFIILNGWKSIGCSAAKEFHRNWMTLTFSSFLLLLLVRFAFDAYVA